MQQNNIATQVRVNWIDWMKVIGMLLIIMGHLTPPGYEYVYVFSVPLFFIISGYLSKVEETSREFWKKTWKRLALPTLILWLFHLFVTNIFVIMKGNFAIERFVTTCLSGIWGGQRSLATLWFVYTLLIIKVVIQHIRKPMTLIAINVVCILACVAFHRFGIAERNAILNVAPAMPMVSFGYYLRKYKVQLNAEPNKGVLLAAAAMVALTVAVLYLNDVPWMFKNGYGNDYAVFVIGGVAGTALVYCVSKLLGRYTSRSLVLLSNGTLVILAIHPQFIRLYSAWGLELGMAKYLLATAILLAFVPILMLLKRYVPILAR